MTIKEFLAMVTLHGLQKGKSYLDYPIYIDNVEIDSRHFIFDNIRGRLTYERIINET